MLTRVHPRTISDNLFSLQIRGECTNRHDKAFTTKASMKCASNERTTPMQTMTMIMNAFELYCYSRTLNEDSRVDKRRQCAKEKFSRRSLSSVSTHSEQLNQRKTLEKVVPDREITYRANFQPRTNDSKRIIVKQSLEIVWNGPLQGWIQEAEQIHTPRWRVRKHQTEN